MTDTTLIALLAALGVRVIRASDLPEPGIAVMEYGILLLDTDLTQQDRDDALEWALRHVSLS